MSAVQNVYHRALCTSCLMIGDSNGHGGLSLKVCDFAYSKNALLDSKPQTAVVSLLHTTGKLLRLSKRAVPVCWCSYRGSQVVACACQLVQCVMLLLLLLLRSTAQR